MRCHVVTRLGLEIYTVCITLHPDVQKQIFISPVSLKIHQYVLEGYFKAYFSVGIIWSAPAGKQAWFQAYLMKYIMNYAKRDVISAVS